MTPEPVQRWRIVYSRGPAARDMTQRAEQEAWETAVTASGLPAVGADAGRPRLGFGIPLPVGLTADAERFDVTLTARLAARRVGPALGRVAPAGHQVVDLHDVWIGEPSLVSRVVAADYRLVVAAAGGEPGVVGEQVLAAACRSLMATRRLERVRRKGDREVSYDLRPFLLAIDAADDARGGVLRMRLGADPATGVGRPDEVVAAVGEALGLSLVMLEGGRERIWLVDELDRQPTGRRAIRYALELVNFPDGRGPWPFEVTIDGQTEPGEVGRRLVASFAAAGAIWWFETLHGDGGDIAALMARVEAGPPR